MGTPLLSVQNLEVTFKTPEGPVQAVNNISFTINDGEVVGVVGESGSGKSQIFMTVMGLLAGNGRAKGSIGYRGVDLLKLPKKKLNKIRGSRMAMIFQDPMTSLNPYLTIERQMTEVLETHRDMEHREAKEKSIELLEKVQIPSAARRISMYPHEFSGGMRQRVMIAMALLCQPELLIADEPTTALDVTIQAQILQLMRELKKNTNNSMVLITHDLGVIAGLCSRVLVMYAGRIVEQGSVQDIFYNPQHPYTMGLLKSMPRLDVKTNRLQTIAGQPPNLQHLPPGCAFADRCPYRQPICITKSPEFRQVAEQRYKTCHLDF